MDNDNAISAMNFGNELWLDVSRFEHIWRVATCLAKTQLVPQHFRGHPEDCFVICQLAFRLNVDPLMMLQKSYVIDGKAGIESQLAIAMINASMKIKGSIKYDLTGEGESLSCRATCETRDGESVSHTLHWRTVESEGWLHKRGSKWKTDPEMMIQYRAAMRLVRLHFPEILMGMNSSEELIEMQSLDRPGITSPERKQARPLPEIDNVSDPDIAILDQTPPVDRKEAADSDDAVCIA